MLEGMRRSIVSSIPILAALVVLGHVVPHLLARRDPAPQPPATLQSAPGMTAPLIAPNCQLQPPLAEADRRPMLVALTLRYPHFTAQHRDLFRRYQTCGVDMHPAAPRFGVVR